MSTKGLRRSGGLFIGAAMCLALLAPPTAAQDRASGRIPTVTRLVRIMMTNEEQLSAALKGGDQAAVERLLADDFEMRVGIAPATPVAREDWIRNALARPGPAREAEQMSAHEMGEVVLASFIERAAASPATRSTGESAPSYVVDVWKRAGDAWKLVRRFVSPAVATGFAPAGYERQLTTLPKRP